MHLYYFDKYFIFAFSITVTSAWYERDVSTFIYMNVSPLEESYIIIYCHEKNEHIYPLVITNHCCMTSMQEQDINLTL